MSGLRAGVVGLGVGSHHVEGYLSSRDVDHVVVCSQDTRELGAIRAKYPRVAHCYTNAEDMYAEENLDVVSVCVPDHLHREHAQLAFDAGCHVLLTKPLATNLEDARAIVAAAETVAKVFMIAHERRFRSGSRLVKQLIEEGYFGELIHVRADTIQDKRGQFAASPWYASEEAGRSAITGSGVHEVDLVRHLVGRPVRTVYAAANRLGSLEFPKDKTTAATYTFDGGAIAQVTVTYEAHWREAGRIANDEFRLVGTDGMVVGTMYRGGEADKWLALPQDEDGVKVGSLGCVARFLESVTDGVPVPVTGDDALASLAAGIAADESAARGEAVPFKNYYP